MGKMNESQLEQLLEALPIMFDIAKGHESPLYPELCDDHIEFVEPVMYASHSASVVALKPPSGCRLQDCSFVGPQEVFSPSRVMDECTGGGSCCSYFFNTADLGLGFEYDLMIDIYKLGN
jgi:hypothetical protein